MKLSDNANKSGTQHVLEFRKKMVNYEMHEVFVYGFRNLPFFTQFKNLVNSEFFDQISIFDHI